MNKPLILVVEDDYDIQRLITTTLETQGYNCHSAMTGKEALLTEVSQKHDVIILDLGLPDMDGLEVIKKVREHSNVPIIIVSARSEDKEKITALDAGADDYLTKPFSVDELLARLRVSLRRVRYDTAKLPKQASLFQNGQLQIDYDSGLTTFAGKEIHLTPIEYKLLCLLAKNIGKILTHNYLLKEVWGPYNNDLPALRVFMATLRKKIEKNSSNQKYIQTHVGVGYRMVQIDSKSKEE